MRYRAVNALAESISVPVGRYLLMLGNSISSLAINDDSSLSENLSSRRTMLWYAGPWWMLCATGSIYRPPGAMFLLKLELKEFDANGNSGEGKTSVSGGICDCCLFSSLVELALIRFKGQRSSTR